MISQKVRQLREIHSAIHHCSKCHNFQKGFIRYDPEKVLRKTIERSTESEIFVVAQSLAKNQVRLSGVPFHDTCRQLSTGGKFLETHFNTIGYTIKPTELSRKYVYTTDLVKCYPGKRVNGNGDNIPTKKEISACRDWFIRELDLINPRVIILFGKPAAKSFFEHVIRVSDLYRKKHVLPIDQKIYSIFVLPHPSSMVKEKKDIFQESFLLIRNELNHNK